ncbi:MAG: TonB-dependent receptor plug domain-containing protein [Bacteroidales bacterium]|nr:TonB-dependent receptor plug domain-containing protein [Bacteroidales bacterium]
MLFAMKAKNITIAALLLLVPMVSLFSQQGVIQGRVYNAYNNQPVEFASVAIFGTSIGSISDLDGNFLFTGLEPGYIELQVSSVGFGTYVSEAILITNAKKVFIDVPLAEANVELDEVVVKASPFRKIKESPVSLQRISIEEIEKSPGGNRDISKVIQSYPGVASTPAQRNDVIVRGGGPSENTFYLDGIEIPNINHFATQGASGGPAGIINADFLREVNLYTGAFPANKSNALSSVIDLYQVDGNPDKLNFRGSVGASDLALTVNGPIGEKTTYIASFRRSYLQYLFQVLELPFLPKYNDYQFKIKTKLNAKNEISLVSIGSYDNNNLNLEANETEEQQFILGYLPESHQWSYAIGAVYKHYGEKGYDTWVLSRNYLHNESNKYQDNIKVDPNLILDYNSDEIENKFRYEHTSSYKGGLRVNYGTNFEYAKFYAKTFNKLYVNRQPITLNTESFLDLFSWGVFGQVSKELLAKRLVLSFGLRADANSYNDDMSNLLNQLSPRISASFLLTDGWYLNFNTGRFFQLPAYTTMGFKNTEGILVNQPELKYIQADHFVAGVEWLPNEESKVSVEGFYKKYNNYPYSLVDSISLASKGADFSLFGAEPVKSIAIGRTYGAEFLYRNRDLFGTNMTISYTLVRSETQPTNSNLASLGWIPTTWDNKHILNIYGFRELKGNWQIGAKWRFVGGQPYTPYDYYTSSLVDYWDVTGFPASDYSQFNQLRFEPFHQLDLRVDKEWFLKRVTINVYLDIQNVYNYKTTSTTFLIQDLDNNGNPVIINPSDPPELQQYRMKELESAAGTVLPTIGVIIEF